MSRNERDLLKGNPWLVEAPWHFGFTFVFFFTISGERTHHSIVQMFDLDDKVGLNTSDFPSSQWDPSFCMPPPHTHTQHPGRCRAGLTLARTTLIVPRMRAAGAILPVVHCQNPAPCMEASL